MTSNEIKEELRKALSKVDIIERVAHDASHTDGAATRIGSKLTQ